MKHKPIPKATRIKVWDKYNHHCAYCGCDLNYEDMQVDHANSLYGNSWNGSDVIQDDNINNLMPACRQCNFYKSVWSIEKFRHLLQDTLQKTAVSSFQARMAIKYGMIEVKKWDGKFYFERIKNDKR